MSGSCARWRENKELVVGGRRAQEDWSVWTPQRREVINEEVSDTTTQTLTIHRLVQTVIKDEMDEQMQRQWAERAVRAVNQVFPFDEPAPWPRSQRYLLHALMCEDLIKQWNITLDEAAELLNNAGFYLKYRGQYGEAAPFLQYALSIQEEMYGRDHPDTDPFLNNLANLYRDQGNYAAAAPLFLRALAIRDMVLGPEHPSTKEVRENYTNLLQKMGQKTEVVDQEG